MKGIPYDPKSTRAIRGKNWENRLFDLLSYLDQDVQKTWDTYSLRFPEMDDYAIAAIEQREGDIIVQTSGDKAIHFECIVCPENGNGYFPEHKRQKFHPASKKEKWYAFAVSSDGLSGEMYFIPARVWNSYSGKLPESFYAGKKFRVYNAAMIRSIRAKQKLSNFINVSKKT